MRERDLYTVISSMLVFIPAERESLCTKLRQVQVSVSFDHPENESVFWNRTRNILADHIGFDPKGGYETIVWEIFNNALVHIGEYK